MLLHSPPHHISIHSDSSQLATLNTTMALFAVNSCVRFVEKEAHHNVFLKIINPKVTGARRGCYAYVGRQVERENGVYLDSDGCITTATVAHELLHALGIYHEFTRYDRESYITIILDNLPRSGCEFLT